MHYCPAIHRIGGILSLLFVFHSLCMLMDFSYFTNEVTRRTPSPPSLTSRLAWSHWRSVRAKLAIAQTRFLKMLSISSSNGCSVHGEQRSMCIIFGALNDALNRINASWADSSDRRLIAVLNSVQRLARAASIFLPGNRGAPRSSASSGARKMKLLNCAICVATPRLIISNLDGLICKPVNSSLDLMWSMSAATDCAGPPG